jgi:hypothetical protein
MEAIKADGIDYILKPFSRGDFFGLIEKVERLSNFFQKNALPYWNALINKIGIDEEKRSFLVFKTINTWQYRLTPSPFLYQERCYDHRNLSAIGIFHRSVKKKPSSSGGSNRTIWHNFFYYRAI